VGVQPATLQLILRHSSIAMTTGTYVEVIEAVQPDALDSMGTLFASVHRLALIESTASISASARRSGAVRRVSWSPSISISWGSRSRLDCVG